jgi:hypothetical protein
MQGLILWPAEMRHDVSEQAGLREDDLNPRLSRQARLNVRWQSAWRSVERRQQERLARRAEALCQSAPVPGLSPLELLSRLLGLRELRPGELPRRAHTAGC